MDYKLWEKMEKAIFLLFLVYLRLPPHSSAPHAPRHFSHSGSVFVYRLRPDARSGDLREPSFLHPRGDGVPRSDRIHSCVRYRY